MPRIPGAGFEPELPRTISADSDMAPDVTPPTPTSPKSATSRGGRSTIAAFRRECHDGDMVRSVSFTSGATIAGPLKMSLSIDMCLTRARTRTEISDNMSEETPLSGDRMESQETLTPLNVSSLIGNTVSQAFHSTAAKDNTTWNFERWLVQLAAETQAAKEASSPKKCFSAGPNWETDSGISPAQEEASSPKKCFSAGPNWETDSGISPAQEGACQSEKHLLRTLFLGTPQAVGDVSVSLQEQHFGMGRVLQTIFAEHALETCYKRKWSLPMLVSDLVSLGACPRFRAQVHSGARRIIEHNGFIGFFLLLSLYVLFGPDMVILWGSREHDFPFLIFNTVCLFLYLGEILLHILGQKDYLTSLVFLLDLIALFSMLADSWFLHSSDFDEERSDSARLARSSRLMRIARVARIVRVTRAIPALTAVLTRQKTSLAKRILLRRLWRAFLFLDADRDGCLAPFDLKFFYASVLYRCPGLLSMQPFDLLARDVPIIHASSLLCAQMVFEDFSRLFLDTFLGKELMRYHLDDLERESGVWSLFRKVSERTSLKLCVGLLCLVSVLQFYSLNTREDFSAQLGLAQLDMIAQGEHRHGAGLDTAHLCEQIQLYAASHEVLVLVLDGWLHWEDGRCVFGAAPLHRQWVPEFLEGHLWRSGLRNQEALRLCWPSSGECQAQLGEGASSFALIDQSSEYRQAGGDTLLTTAIVIPLLLLYMYVLNAKMTQFCKTLLQPLRALLDDMVVLSSIELTELDEDVPVETFMGRKESFKYQASDEIQDIQDSFKTMRTAIRSWSRYVPPAVVQGLFRAGLEATIGVSKCSATILFCDINSFADICTGISPTEVLHLLAAVTSIIANIIQVQRGTLLEFIGDEVLAVFNAPEQIKNHASAGVFTAIQINDNLTRYRFEATESETEIPIKCRCGVHTGPVFAGNIGSKQRMKYGLLGDGVNLTSRLKGLNTRYNTSTLVSESCMSQAKHTYFRPIDLVAVKGRSGASMVYEPMTDKALCGKQTEAFRAYMARDFEEALNTFDEVRQALEVPPIYEDFPTRILAERCRGYLRERPPDDWDGVERMVHKAFEDGASRGGSKETTDPSRLRGLSVDSMVESVISEETVDVSVASASASASSLVLASL